MHLHVGSASAKRVGQDMVTHRVLCTQWLLGLAVKGHGWDQVTHLALELGNEATYCPDHGQA